MSKANNTSKDYTFSDVYTIEGRGVGTLDLKKALKSNMFVEKMGQLAGDILAANPEGSKTHEETQKTNS